MKPLLVVIAGPTAVGKTAISLQLADLFSCPIISADSRQFYKELKIGTARPSDEELQKIKHYFIAHLSVNDYYNVSLFEQDVNNLFTQGAISSPVCILAGGSGLYINAVCNGIAEMPDVDPELRRTLIAKVENEGLDFLKEKLKEIDPETYDKIDLNNKNRLLRAVEMNLTTGKTLAEVYRSNLIEKPFRVVKIALNLPREELYQRINSRTDKMIEDGLCDEAKSVFHLRHLNALNTVGYKELFQYFEGNDSLEDAIEKIKTSTRKYAKRQMTWFRADKDYHWFAPNQMNEITSLIRQNL